MCRHHYHACIFFLKASDSLHLTTRLLCNSKPERTRLSQNGSWLRQQTTWERPPSPLWLSGSLFDRHLPWMLALPGSSSLLMLLQDHLSTGPTAVAHIVSSSVSSGFQCLPSILWVTARSLQLQTLSEGKWKHIRINLHLLNRLSIVAHLRH